MTQNTVQRWREDSKRGRPTKEREKTGLKNEVAIRKSDPR